MKIAVAYGNGRISPMFDTARELVLIEVERGRELRRTTMALTGQDPLERVRLLLRLGAGVVLCGAVSRGVETALIGAGIEVCSFIRGELDGVIAAFLTGNLDEARYRMPGKSKTGS